MFGHIMEFDVQQKLGEPLLVRMAPLHRDDMSLYIKNGGMQSLNVVRYLGRTSAPVLEDEQEWFDHIRADKNGILWGIYVLKNQTWELVGSTSIGGITANTMFRRGTSGCMVFDQNFWGKGLASHCHRARTMYAFGELGLSCIYSSAYNVNKGSIKALERIGYVQTGFNRNEGMHAGNFLHIRHFELINPASWAWNAWWGSDTPAKKWLEARAHTVRALEWAGQNVTFP